MSTYDWLRLWHDMPNDPKWRTVAKASGQRIGDVIAVYVHLLVCASTASDRGRTQALVCEDVASALDMQTSEVEAIITAMQNRLLVGDRLMGWEKRQPKREDGSAERSKARREAKKHEKDRNKTGDEQGKPLATASDRNQSLDKIRLDKKNIKSIVGLSSDEMFTTRRKHILTGASLEQFLKFWEAFDYKSGKAEAADAWLDLKPLPGDTFNTVLDGAKREASRRQALIDAGGTPKMAQGWLSGRRWEDEGTPRPAQRQIAGVHIPENQDFLKPLQVTS